MAHETADDLKTNVANAFGIPSHLMAAWHAWIDSVEERLGMKSTTTRPVLNREDDSTGDTNMSGTTQEDPNPTPTPGGGGDDTGTTGATDDTGEKNDSGEGEGEKTDSDQPDAA